jgi:hypothetical protein
MSKSELKYELLKDNVVNYKIKDCIGPVMSSYQKAMDFSMLVFTNLEDTPGNNHIYKIVSLRDLPLKIDLQSQAVAIVPR